MWGRHFSGMMTREGGVFTMADSTQTSIILLLMLSVISSVCTQCTLEGGRTLAAGETYQDLTRICTCPAYGGTQAQCRTCPRGRWGVGCVGYCGNCSGVRKECDIETGHCPSHLGCNGGYTGPACNDTCRIGTFGRGCVLSCTCKSGTCDPVEGRCRDPIGVNPIGNPQQNGQRPPMDSSRVTASNYDCVAGTWGEQCWKDCSEHCLEKECIARDGTCTLGCAPGYQGDACDTAVSDNDMAIGLAVGGCVLLVVIIVVVVLICVRRHRNPKSNIKRDSSYLTPVSPSRGPVFSNNPAVTLHTSHAYEIPGREDLEPIYETIQTTEPRSPRGQLPEHSQGIPSYISVI